MERPENRRAQSRALTLPDLPIIPVHRSDGSGTTFIFTDYFSSVNPAWADTVGKGTSVKWPAGIGLGAKGSEGVAGQVKQIPGAIGYVELAYADQNKMPYADVKNAAGNFISPAPDSVSAALATAKVPDDFRFSMVNRAGRQGLSHRRRELGAGLSTAKERRTRQKTRRLFEMGGHGRPENFAHAGLRAVARQRPAAGIEPDRHN